MKEADILNKKTRTLFKLIQNRVNFASNMKASKMTKILISIVLFTFTISFNIFSQTPADELFNLGMIKLKAMELDSATYYFNKALETDSTYSDAAFRRGFIKDKLNDLDGAYEDYTLAITISAKPVYLNNRGMIKFITGDYNKAIEDFDHAIILDSNYLIALFNKGRTYVEMKQNEKGCIYMREAYDKGLTIIENAIDYYCN